MVVLDAMWGSSEASGYYKLVECKHFDGHKMDMEYSAIFVVVPQDLPVELKNMGTDQVQ